MFTEGSPGREWSHPWAGVASRRGTAGAALKNISEYIVKKNKESMPNLQRIKILQASGRDDLGFRASPRASPSSKDANA